MVMVLALCLVALLLFFFAFMTSAVFASASDFLCVVVSRLRCFATAFLYIQIQMNSTDLKSSK